MRIQESIGDDLLDGFVSASDKSRVREKQYLAYRRIIMLNLVGYTLSIFSALFFSFQYNEIKFIALVAIILSSFIGWRYFYYKKFMRKFNINEEFIKKQENIALYTTIFMAVFWMAISNFLVFNAINTKLDKNVILNVFSILYVISFAQISSSTRNMTCANSLSKKFIFILSFSTYIMCVQIVYSISFYIGMIGLIFAIFLTLVSTIGTRKLSELFIHNAVQEIEAERNIETIKVLLDDYEQQGVGWLWTTDHNQAITKPSAKFLSALQRDIEAVDGASLADLFKSGPEATSLKKNLKQGTSFRNLEIPIIVGGREYWWRLNARAVATGGVVRGMRGVATDISEEVRAKSEIEYLSKYDQTTGLENRNVFNKKLDKLVKKSISIDRHAIIILSIENLGEMSSAVDSSDPENIVKLIASRFENVETFDSRIARIGENKFVVLLPKPSSSDYISKVAKSAIDALSVDIKLGKRIVQPHVNCGISIYPVDGTNAPDLISNATLALNAALKKGRGHSAFFDPSMEAAASSRRRIEHGLMNALKDKDLSLAYQPVIEAATEQVVGYEALMRWAHPEHGNIPPSEFIPIAEETGQISALGYWLIREAVNQALKWDESIVIAINLSPAQLDDVNFLTNLDKIIESAGISPSRIEFEVTEGIFIQQSEHKIAILNDIVKRGFRVALDDFGTGYSSLSYIQAFSFTKIKIDKCFIDNIEHDLTCRSIVSAIINLANSVGVITTAEGVENRQQFDRLLQMGCTQVQGYLFGKPVAAAELAIVEQEAVHRQARAG